MPYYLHRIEYKEIEYKTTFVLPDLDDNALAQAITDIKNTDTSKYLVDKITEETLLDHDVFMEATDQRPEIMKKESQIKRLQMEIDLLKKNGYDN